MGTRDNFFSSVLSNNRISGSEEVKHYPYIALSLTIGILVMVGYIFYLLFGPYTTPTLGNITPTDPVTAGHLARYTAQDCHITNQEAEVSRTLIGKKDSLEVIVGLDSAVIRKLACSNIMLIPLSTPTGDYTLVITAKVQVNPIRTVIREYKSIQFHVDNPNPDAVIPPEISEVPTVPINFSPSGNQPIADNPSSPVIQQASKPSPQPTPQQPPQRSFISPVVDTVNNALKRVGL